MCAICGNENARWRIEKRQRLCDRCAGETKDKLPREKFYLVYWGENFLEVPRAVRTEFYEDYLASKGDINDYIAQTRWQ